MWFLGLAYIKALVRRLQCCFLRLRPFPPPPPPPRYRVQYGAISFSNHAKNNSASLRSSVWQFDSSNDTIRYSVIEQSSLPCGLTVEIFNPGVDQNRSFCVLFVPARPCIFFPSLCESIVYKIHVLFTLLYQIKK